MKTHTLEISALIVGIVLGVMYLVFSTSHISYGSAPSGLPAAFATSSTVDVGTTTIKTLFSSDTGCSSRVISTGSQPIMLSFGSSTISMTPTAQVGFVQGASTTVAYDSGVYGCGKVNAYGYQFSTSASTTVVTIMETL